MTKYDFFNVLFLLVILITIGLIGRFFAPRYKSSMVPFKDNHDERRSFYKYREC